MESLATKTLLTTKNTGAQTLVPDGRKLRHQAIVSITLETFLVVFIYHTHMTRKNRMPEYFSTFHAKHTA
jgi:hypothetical protein